MLTNQLYAYGQIILLQSLVDDVYRERMEITSNITIKMSYFQAVLVYDLIFLVGVKDASNFECKFPINNNCKYSSCKYILGTHKVVINVIITKKNKIIFLGQFMYFLQEHFLKIKLSLFSIFSLVK